MIYPSFEFSLARASDRELPLKYILLRSQRIMLTIYTSQIDITSHATIRSELERLRLIRSDLASSISRACWRLRMDLYLEGERHEIVRGISLHLLNLLENPLHRRILPVISLVRHVLLAQDLSDSIHRLKSRYCQQHKQKILLF